jgi:muramoyltetrapeptide carboxypeptidase
MPSCDSSAGLTALEPRALAEELHRALRDPSIDGVIVACGGWTLLLVLPFLDYELIGASAKPVVGYSDAASLVNLVAQRADLVAFHGPMALPEWGEAGGSWELTSASFQRVVGDESWSELAVPVAEVWSDEVLWWDREDDRARRGSSDGESTRVVRAGAAADGVLWGGSIVALGLLAGTDLWPAPSGALVFLEAEAVAPDELAARLWQLRLAGAFDGAAAVMLGKIGQPRATSWGYADFDGVLAAAVPEGIPLVAGLDIGHTEPMVTLPVGARAILSAEGSRPSLTLHR